jgi:CubicO group peptidase (beta-lactamase class C family)
VDLTEQLDNATKLIDRWLAYKVSMDRIPGLSIGVVYKNTIIFSKGYGYADAEKKVKASATTCYRIASFSKVFTAIAILQLAEQGKLHLDDRVQSSLPWFTSEHDLHTSHITIRQLLTHTAGLDRDGNTPHWIDFQFPSLDQVQQHIAAGAMISAPAEKWKYSNFGYTILGELIKVVSGVPYEDYMNEHIVKQLGLSHTAPTLTDNIVENLAVGYSRNIPGQERESFPLIETNAMAPATGFSSNVLDICTLMMAQFEGNTSLLSEESKREMRRIQWLREGFDSDWSLGFQTWKINERRIYGHGGSFQGYKSRFGIDIDREVGVVILANAIDAPSTDLANSALQTIDYLINHFAEFAESNETVENVKRYEGRFRNIWEDIDIVAISNSCILYTSAAAWPVHDFCRLRYERDDQFTMISGDSIGNIGEPVRFEFDDEGIARRVFIGPNPSDRIEDQE